MVEVLRKLVWVFEFWNEMLVSNIRCKNLSKRSSFRKFFFTRILKREGWEINDLSPLSWQFFWNFMTFGWFSKVKSFWNRFLFQENSNISNLISWNVRLFWILSFAKDVLFTENWLCFRACNSQIVTCDQEFCLVVWFFLLNHFYGIFFLKSFPSRNHGVVENMCSFSKSYL